MNYTPKNLSNKFNIVEEILIPRHIADNYIPKIIKVAESLPKAYRCRSIVIFLLRTGCRVSEVSKIRVRDFDIQNEVIYIMNSKGKKDRVIPMFKEVREEILNYLNKSGMVNWDPNCNGYLFARDEGIVRSRKFPVRTIEQLVERIRYKLPEINYLTPHIFRHTFAVKCLKLGISLHQLTLILGHSNPKTTMIYTQLYDKDLKELITEKFPFPFENLLSEIITKENT
ncbi:tyrosine-type recombinase/integrase [Solibacillus merdavium]|uniref:tyrosine-type recombinase/integrase n=1 Tax=Solibacillus merdavium TaxID=2762218 RepID=UPI001CD8B42A|nr:site-specific integrase [Solibacillus merdavium]